MSDAKDAIETGIGSIGKVKIIKALVEEGKMATIYVLHKRTGLKRDDIKNNLDDLLRIGWIRHAKYASVVYGLNNDNEYVSRLVQFFKDTGYAQP
ncbi:MAG: hypothetical protein ACREAY_07745 [Nitrososphaera sp.]|uniref:hypothetical protein n=1 Tax=Nitrososphaera sp. TaxID=1971748 RepID=UPI003D6F9B36